MFRFSPQTQKLFPSVFSKRCYLVSLRMQTKSIQKKPARRKKTSCGRISKQTLTIVSKINNLEANKKRFSLRKTLPSKKNPIPPSSAMCVEMEQFFCPCFRVQQQKFEYSVSYNVGSFWISSWPKSHIPFFTPLDAARRSPTVVFSQNAKTKKRASWVAFQIWTSKITNVVHSRCCCSWICAQFIKG